MDEYILPASLLLIRFKCSEMSVLPPSCVKKVVSGTLCTGYICGIDYFKPALSGEVTAFES